MMFMSGCVVGVVAVGILFGIAVCEYKMNYKLK